MSGAFTHQYIQGEVETLDGELSWRIADGILHVEHRAFGYDEVDEFHYRLVPVRADWVEVTE